MDSLHLTKELQEFILSFNTTLCFGIGLFIFIVMKNHTSIVEQETIDKIGDNTIKFMPVSVMNLIGGVDNNAEDVTVDDSLV